MIKCFIHCNTHPEWRPLLSHCHWGHSLRTWFSQGSLSPGTSFCSSFPEFIGERQFLFAGFFSDWPLVSSGVPVWTNQDRSLPVETLGAGAMIKFVSLLSQRLFETDQVEHLTDLLGVSQF